MNKIVVFWFRRDLRLDDNIGLFHALSTGLEVLPIFIFDTDILSQLDTDSDRRVSYIHDSLSLINRQLGDQKSGLKTYLGTPLEVFTKLTEEYAIDSVYCNRDYEPQAIERDLLIKNFLNSKGINLHDYKDQVIFEKSEITKDDGKPYTVYTPYSKKWKANLGSQHYNSVVIDYNNFIKGIEGEVLALESIGFKSTDFKFTIPQLNEEIIVSYHLYRDFPELDRTTYLGVALRFGTISIRKCVAFARIHNETWLNELIWREFFMQILYHFPHVATRSFKQQYDAIEWRNNEEDFNAWCEGKTGYPIVDAGMRQLNETGFMHNRVRMIVASFLCKHLLIDWRWGEVYFAKHLLDYDLSANNGNWQWAAGCGCDAAPYFRIFNPTSQTLKFDKELKYVRKWNPDFELQLTSPIVDHQFARERVLKAYKKALDKV